MSRHNVNAETLVLIKRWEGLRLEGYLCPADVDGAFRFVIQSTDPEYPYYEAFEISNVNEAKAIVRNFVDEISPNVEKLFGKFDEKGLTNESAQGQR